jgi:2-oxoglutarate dehydrogenase E2 component (dihydrolipoamide succinyltransferase)
VALDEPIAVLETDKVTIDVQAPAAGVIESLAFGEGAKVKIGDVLGAIAPGAGAAKTAPAAAAPAPAPAAAAPAPAAPGPAPAAAAEPAAPAGGPSPTPVARAIAADKGVDPGAIAGSGVKGRVMKDDVVRATAAQSTPPAQAPAPAPAAAQVLARTPGQREERVPMTPLRRRVAERLLQAQSTAAILTTFNEVDMSAVMALRKSYNERFEKKHGIKLGFMSLFVKAAVDALKAFPAVNGSIEGQDVVFHHYHDIGVAVSGSRGLVVPVIRDADQKSLAELEKVIADYGARARTDKLQLAELQGGTFTISNGGIFGSMLSTPILNPPQTGILGMHAILDRPVVRDGQIVARPMMYLALSYDHRLVDGREAVQFLVRLKECVEAPERLLLDL